MKTTIKHTWIPRTTALLAIVAIPISQVLAILPTEIYDGAFLSIALIHIGCTLFNAAYLWRLVRLVERNHDRI